MLNCFSNRKLIKGRQVDNPVYKKLERQVVKTQQEQHKDFEIYSKCSRKAWVVLNWRVLKNKLSLLCGGWIIGMPGGYHLEKVCK